MTPSRTASSVPTSTKTLARPRWSRPSLGESNDLAPFGKACFKYMLSNHASLGCVGDLWCMCSSKHFESGVRGCVTHTCPREGDHAVNRINALLCMRVFQVFLPTDPAAPSTRGWRTLSACGQDCLSSMLAQNAALGCDSRDPTCLCGNSSFEADLRNCADPACGADVAPTTVDFGTSYCQTVREVYTATASVVTLPECGEIILRPGR